MAEDTATVENTEGAGDTENAPRRKRNTSPDGQTAAGSAELGDGGDFADPTTRVDTLGEARPTRVRRGDRAADEGGETPKIFTQLTKALGLKSADLLSFNEASRVAVYANGGKYQISKNGKGLRHLSGPVPPTDLKLNVQDARHRSPFTGTAAALNAPAAVVETDENALRDRRAALEAELAEVNEQLGDEEE